MGGLVLPAADPLALARDFQRGTASSITVKITHRRGNPVAEDRFGGRDRREFDNAEALYCGQSYRLS